MAGAGGIAGLALSALPAYPLPMSGRLALFAALVLAAAPLPAMACSVVPGYRVPTNLELVQGAELILLARVTGGQADAAQPWNSRLLVEPIAAIKGDLPPGPITLSMGMLADDGFVVLSNPYEFTKAHPLSYIGGCVRYIFPLGTTVLFFLKWQDGEWQAAGGPFSRWAEDVPEGGGPWMALAALYARVGDLPVAERTAMLAQERDRLLARKDDPVAQLMAADIARQIGGPDSGPEPAPDADGWQTGAGGEGQGNSGQGNSVDAALEAMRGASGN